MKKYIHFTNDSKSNENADFDDFDNDDDDIYDFDENDLGTGYQNVNYKKDDEIIYLGKTGGRTKQRGVVHKIRDDGKYVIRFDDNKLIAISKKYLKPADIKAVEVVVGEKWWEKNKWKK